MARTRRWSVCDDSNKWGVEKKKNKPKKSKWSVCDQGNKWSIEKKKD
ncbi:hypothetical protein [Sulfurimonas microaerophilic]|nr:hypothetical protein [Sulfurimonas sp. hsl 1-7]